jgi:4-amino-4-deoxy-L-arabinose transferase-like glycosyltransferase
MAAERGFFTGRESGQQWLRALAWAITCWIIVFWRLGYLPLLDPDEAHYAQITREMSRAHEWFVPLLDGQPHIDKPVLFHWLQGTSFWLLGWTEFAARLPSALAALALMAVTAWFGTRLFDRRIGERAAVLLATLPATFALSSVAIFDMVFAVCLFGALACLTVGTLERRTRLQDLGFVLTAAAVLTKGPVAVVLLSLTAGACLAHPATRAAARHLRWLRGAIIVLAIAAPWFLWMWYRFGQTFVDLYILTNNLSLFGQPLYRRHRYPFFYGRVLLTAFLPWSLLLIGRAVDLVRQRTRPRELAAGEFLLWSWFLAVVIFFSLSWFKLDTYIFPAAPAMCLLASHAWERARGRESGDAQTREARRHAADEARDELSEGNRLAWDAGRTRDAGRDSCVGVRVGFAAVALTFIAAGVMIGLFLFKLNLPVPQTAVLLPIALVLGGTLFGVRLWRGGWQPPSLGPALIVSLICAYGTVVALGFPVLQRTRPTMDIACWVVSATAPGEALAVYRLGRWQASLRFYAGRPVTLLDDPDDVQRFFEQHQPAQVVVTQRDFDQLQAAGVPLQILYKRRAVVGTEGQGFRRSRWGGVLVVTRQQP